MNSRRSQAALTAGVLLVLVAALVVGCAGPSGTGGLGSDQGATASSGAGDAGGETPAMIVNDAISDRPGPIEPSSGRDHAGSQATEPGVPDVPSGESTRTRATTPGVDPSSQDAPSATSTPAPGEPPAGKGSDDPPSGDDLGALTRGNGDFAFDLYRKLSAADGNLFFSPHSISTALAMTYAGAEGGTRDAMADTLRFSLPPDRLHGAFEVLSRDLDTRTTGEDEDSFRLNVANAVWAQEGHPFRDDYLDVVKASYGGEVSLANFVGDPDGSRSEINGWVGRATEGKIEDLIPPDLIDVLTRMVLVNAVYFKAGWLYPFDEAFTATAPFHLLDGMTADVEMMSSTQYFGYGSGDGYQVVALPYVGGEMYMAVLLPDPGRFQEFEERLDADFLDQVLGQVGESYVALEMPRFGFDAAFRLGETLQAMGMVDAFAPGAADFSGMDGLSCAAGDEGCLYIGAVVHKAFVSVDESGTEAAAATAVMMQTESAKPSPLAVRVDRPFVFLIRDYATGTLLFVGRVTEP